MNFVGWAQKGTGGGGGGEEKMEKARKSTIGWLVGRDSARFFPFFYPSLVSDVGEKILSTGEGIDERIG